MSPCKSKKGFTQVLIIFTLIVLIGKAAQFKQLENLIEEKFSDQTSIVRLADQQKFSIPLNGRYISYEIEYFPQKSTDCTFKQPNVEYKKLAESNKLFDQEDQVVNMLVLKRSEKVILADPYFNIIVYSTDEHKLLRLLSPKTSLLSGGQALKNKQMMVHSISMITTEEQDYIYYLSPNNSFVFASKSLGSQIDKLNVTLPKIITKAIYHKHYVVIISAEQGIFIYKVDKIGHTLEKVQTIKREHYHNYIDLELDTKNQLFYALTESSVEVYLFNPSDFPNPESHQFTVLKNLDEINLLNYTIKHIQASNVQNSQHLNLEISSSNSNQNQIFILFRHNMRQNVIAEFAYNPSKKEVTFLRYFKFQMDIKQIHTIEDVIVVVGNQILGMFPYGIDPRLIKEEFNGWITMGDMQKIIVTEAPYFVGVTKNSIQFGGLMFSQEIGLNCQFNQASLTKYQFNLINLRSIVFSGKLTWCNSDQNRFYNTYCSYNKKFILQPMQIVTTSMISSSVWIIMLICTVCIILGILIMLMYFFQQIKNRMHKRKQVQIKKLELYFEEKRRTAVPASSDRRGEK